ncbi:hypothetical protein VNO77_04109 [Canavalia gladiata]|uniref:Uncharacterized protein n=1 Tax=Canavalia gladiata TaxID=3824 RepID=A0AAN9R7G9_CANGL
MFPDSSSTKEEASFLTSIPEDPLRRQVKLDHVCKKIFALSKPYFNKNVAAFALYSAMLLQKTTMWFKAWLLDSLNLHTLQSSLNSFLLNIALALSVISIYNIYS